MKETRETYQALLSFKKPMKQPLDGAIEMHIKWIFPRTKVHKTGQWKITKPDLDNMNKAIQDSLQTCGYIANDSRIARLLCEKGYGEKGRIIIELQEIEGGFADD